MTARLTVVLDDDDLYRRAKVRAAEEGIPMKRVVEEALAAYLEGGKGRLERSTTVEKTLAFMEEMRARDDNPDGPVSDYSDIKHHLYGYPKQRLTPENFTEFVEALQPSQPREAKTG